MGARRREAAFWRQRRGSPALPSTSPMGSEPSSVLPDKRACIF